MTIVTQSELEKELGKTRDQIRTLRGKGLPVEKEGNKSTPYEYVLEDVLDWYQDYETTQEHEARIKELEADVATEKDADIKAAKLRKLVIEGDRLEIKLQQDRREVVQIEEVGAIIDEQMSVIKAPLLEVPYKAVPIMAAKANINDASVIAAMTEILMDYQIDALRDLSTEEATRRLGYEQEESDNSE